jgi:N-acetylglucosaminyldiphosphoundecaprenol N-acetyl-beta-D-mannosaminyltransferase
MMDRSRIWFLGQAFDRLTMPEAVAEILAGTERPFRFIVTPNVHHLVRLHDDGRELRASYDRAWRVLCDSRILARLAALRGVELPVVTGSDLTAALVPAAAKRCLSVTVIGSTAEDCAKLAFLHPGLRIEFYAPPMGFIRSEAEIARCVDFVVAKQSDLVFLAVGMPQQEILARRIADNPEARGVGLCIGASIDFLTGKQQRAPRWVQKLSLEWLYRLGSDPRRLARRYLIECPRIFYLFALDTLSGAQGEAPRAEVGR